MWTFCHNKTATHSNNYYKHLKLKLELENLELELELELDELNVHSNTIRVKIN